MKTVLLLVTLWCATQAGLLGCTVDTDCSLELACQDGECVDPCVDFCRTGEICTVTDHIPQCSCPQETTSLPYGACVPAGCIVDTECSLELACQDGECIDPCVNFCRTGEICTVTDHVPQCSCPQETTSLPYGACVPAGCTVDKDCSLELACQHGECIDPCLNFCRIGEICTATDHVPQCSCPQETTSLPYGACVPAVCTVDADCSLELACQDGECIDPCADFCRTGEICTVIYHVPQCSCPQETFNLPYGACVPGGCTVDTDCSLELACQDGECIDPCVDFCRTGEICTVTDHVPQCICPQETTSLPYGACVPAGCTIDTDCSSQLVCISEQCVDPCIELCGTGADCAVNNRVPECSCPPGTTGDPLVDCSPIGCAVDTDCSLDLACIDEQCVDPCPDCCGTNAECKVVDHITQCSCPPGTTGDAFVGCTPLGCTVDTDCALELACTDGKCVDPCPDCCGTNAECKVVDHITQCSCPPETTGDAFATCTPLGCTVDTDCALELACTHGQCVDPCPDWCGTNAECKVVDHITQCSCPPGTTGDAFVGCTPLGCTVDTDCALELACTDGQCVDPCHDCCGTNAECKVVDHITQCSCPPGTTGDAFATCTPLGCTVDDNCAHNLACLKGKCANPCDDFCGTGASCNVKHHIPHCRCPAQTSGNPHVACIPIGCTVDGDCSHKLACLNGQCADPCDDFCGTSAVCKVIRHVPHCRCPPRTRGDPLISCTPIGCTVSSHCPDHMACADQHCKYPCVDFCGTNAVCRVVSHIPHCSCPMGTTGNPVFKCTKIECTDNSDCPHNMACINARCRITCEGFCGINASCAVTDHTPHCTCPTGTTGNPHIGCTPIGTHSGPCKKFGIPMPLTSCSKKCRYAVLNTGVCPADLQCCFLE